MYNSLFNNPLENAGVNAATAVWKGAEYLTHYGSPLIIYGGYKTICGGYKALSSGLSVVRWAFSCEPAPAAPAPVAPPPVVPVAERSGWIMTGVKLALLPFLLVLKPAWWVFKQVWPILGMEWISDFLHRAYLREGFWDKYKGIGVAFLRPLMEKLLPHLYYVYDQGDINFSLRDLAFGASTMEEKNFLLRGVYFVRGGVVCTLTNCGTAIEEHAYKLGVNAANTLEALGTLTKDVIVGSTQVGPCLSEISNAQSLTVPCVENATNYLVDRFQGIYEMSAPIRGALGDCAQTALGLANLALTEARNLSATALATSITYAQQGAQFAVSYGDQILRDVAMSVAENYGIPQDVVYYAEVGTLAAAGLFTAYKTAQFAYNWAIPEAARSFVSRLWTRPAAHEVRVGALPGAAAP